MGEGGPSAPLCDNVFVSLVLVPCPPQQRSCVGSAPTLLPPKSTVFGTARMIQLKCKSDCVTPSASSSHSPVPREAFGVHTVLPRLPFHRHLPPLCPLLRTPVTLATLLFIGQAQQAPASGLVLPDGRTDRRTATRPRDSLPRGAAQMVLPRRHSWHKHSSPASTFIPSPCFIFHNSICLFILCLFL